MSLQVHFEEVLDSTANVWGYPGTEFLHRTENAYGYYPVLPRSGDRIYHQGYWWEVVTVSIYPTHSSVPHIVRVKFSSPG